MTYKKSCEYCGKSFETKYKTKKYCGKRCSEAAQSARRYRRKNPNASKEIKRRKKLFKSDTHKECGRCGEILLLDRFHRNGDKIKSMCKECIKTVPSKKLEYKRIYASKVEALETGQDWKEIYQRRLMGRKNKPNSWRKTYQERAMDENMKTANGIRKEVEGAVLFLRRKLCKERGVFWCRECKKELPQSLRSAGAGGATGRCKPCDNKRRLSSMFGKNWKGTSAYKEWLREYRREQKKDPQYKVKNENRNRIRRAIIAQTGDARRVPKGKVKYLGCDPAQAVAYLESMFVGHMSWDNYGKAWHIDHVIPCASFDLTKEEEIAKCFHYTNLQPMWARTNIRKGARTGHAHQPRLLV